MVSETTTKHLIYSGRTDPQTSLAAVFFAVNTKLFKSAVHT